MVERVEQPTKSIKKLSVIVVEDFLENAVKLMVSQEQIKACEHKLELEDIVKFREKNARNLGK